MGVGEKTRDGTAKQHKILVLIDENILKLTVVIVYILKKALNYMIKKVNCMICQSYFSKAANK